MQSFESSGKILVVREVNSKMEELLTVKEMAVFLKVSERTVYNLVEKGMPMLKIGHQNRFKASDVMKWNEEQRKK